MKQLLCVTLFAALLLHAPAAFGGARTDDPLGVAISPQMLLLGTAQSGTVVVHTDIPLSAVDRLTLELDGIPAVGSYADALGHLVAVFDEGAVKSIVAPPWVELTLSGYLVNGEVFYGSDAVMVEVYRGR